MIYYEPDTKLYYKESAGLSLPAFVYMPRRDIPCPHVVLVIHGGGWTTGIKDDTPWQGNMMKYQASRFSQLGHIGIEMSYRSINLPGTDINDLIADTEDCVRYIRNLDICKGKKLIVIGDSAGGHLGVMLGISSDDTVRPDGVIACNPVLDCMKKFQYTSENPDTRLCASPLYCNLDKCARFLFMHGTNDVVVPPEDSQIMHMRILANGGSSELIMLDGEKHAFILYKYQNTEERVDELMKPAEDFVNNF